MRSLQHTILDLWHISRTALAGGNSVPTRYDRMIYVKKELTARHADLVAGLTPKKIWLTIEETLQ